MTAHSFRSKLPWILLSIFRLGPHDAGSFVFGCVLKGRKKKALEKLPAFFFYHELGPVHIMFGYSFQMFI